LLGSVARVRTNDRMFPEEFFQEGGVIFVHRDIFDD
jgi:hypothetical protein